MTRAPQLVGSSVSTAARLSTYWLLAKRSQSRLEVLTTNLAGGRRVLPVFSFEEEAAFYLRIGTRGSCWARPTGAGELVSLLYGLCSEVELVALDPVSEVEADLMSTLVCLKRRSFVNVILRREASVGQYPHVSLAAPASAVGGRPSTPAEIQALCSGTGWQAP